MAKVNTPMYAGGALIGVANYLADRQQPLLKTDKLTVKNSELLSAVTILGDLFFGRRVFGPWAGVLDGAVAGASYELARVVADTAVKEMEKTGVSASRAPVYQQPVAGYQEPRPAFASAPPASWETEYQ